MCNDRKKKCSFRYLWPINRHNVVLDEQVGNKLLIKKCQDWNFFTNYSLTSFKLKFIRSINRFLLKTMVVRKLCLRGLPVYNSIEKPNWLPEINNWNYYIYKCIVCICNSTEISVKIKYLLNIILKWILVRLHGSDHCPATINLRFPETV